MEESFCDAVVFPEHVEKPALLEDCVLCPVLPQLARLPPQPDGLALPAEVEERLDGVVEVEPFERLGIRVVGEVGHR